MQQLSIGSKTGVGRISVMEIIVLAHMAECFLTVTVASTKKSNALNM